MKKMSSSSMGLVPQYGRKTSAGLLVSARRSKPESYGSIRTTICLQTLPRVFHKEGSIGSEWGLNGLKAFYNVKTLSANKALP